MAFRGADAAGLMQFLRSCRNFDKVLEKVTILALSDGKCSAEVKVDESHTNPMGGLHGGFSATLVDCISTYALMTQVAAPNVSVDIHMSYLKGAKIGDEILVDANVIKKGKTLAFLDVVIKNKSNGDVLVKGSHTKFIMQ
ncbi:hypothetical protein Zmor_027753 [Zophobas morio]|uniref:Thioesterase domain-containing protein n=1 Tax=Zophobas morio TaxID=2755281 RepID=A0AA38HNV6_9CUCU|nr:hypothetical protein Zmor_027753 [Zophobas morio]